MLNLSDLKIVILCLLSFCGKSKLACITKPQIMLNQLHNVKMFHPQENIHLAVSVSFLSHQPTVKTYVDKVILKVCFL